jgi:signal transduction histidine kinase/DNA-binding response OmpR family regulator
MSSIEQTIAPQSSAPADARLARTRQKVREQQIAALCAGSWFASLGGIIGGGFAVWAFWPSVEHRQALIWYAALVLAIVVRQSVAFVYQRSAPAPEDIEHRARVYAILTGVVGLTYGAAAFTMYVPGSIPQQMLLTTILICGALFATSIDALHDLSTFRALVYPALFPIVLRFLSEGDIFHLGAAALVGTMGPFMLRMGRFLNSRMRESLEVKELLAEQKAEAEKLREKAEAANRAKSQFLAAASHDLRQPIAALGLFLEVLDARVSDPAARPIVQKIRSSIEAMEGLFNALLDISRLDAGVMTPQIQHFPVQALLDKVDADYTRLAADKGISLRVMPSDQIVVSDPFLLEQLLRNLVSNAVRYTDTGWVKVECLERTENVALTVTDTGIGIPEEHLGDIFQEFYQLGNPERDRNKGLGLGLAIVKRITTLLAHQLSVKSRVGVGTTCVLEVPLGCPSENVSESDDVILDIAMIQGKRVLVIDDEANIREAMQMLLEDWGCEVLVASSGIEALTKLQSLQLTPDLIICDYRLREHETGIEAIRAVERHAEKHVPAVLVTGDTAPDRLREASESGYELLHKPVSPKKLRVTLCSLLVPAASVAPNLPFMRDTPLTTSGLSSDPRSRKEKGRAASALDGKLVLLVDDDARVRSGTEDLLRQWGCHIACAGSVEEAGVVLERELRFPDLVVTNDRVAQESAIEVIKAVRAYTAELTPAAIITDQNSGRTGIEVEGGPCSLIEKPLSPERLRDHLVAALVARLPTVAEPPELPLREKQR